MLAFNLIEERWRFENMAGSKVWDICFRVVLGIPYSALGRVTSFWYFDEFGTQFVP